MYWRFLSILALILGLTAFTGCSDDDDATDEPTDTGGDMVEDTGGDMVEDTGGDMVEDTGEPDPAIVWFRVFDGTETYEDGQLLWKGSFIYDADNGSMVLDGSWTGPYPPLYDDGPISEGGHEAEGQTADDGWFSTQVEVVADADEDTDFEYGLVNELDGWLWDCSALEDDAPASDSVCPSGGNGTFTVPAGSSDTIQVWGMVLEGFGDVDLMITFDASSLHADFVLDDGYERIGLKGAFTSWGNVWLADDGAMGDETADDDVYTYLHSERLPPHSGLFDVGDAAEFVMVLDIDDDDEAVLEYKALIDPDGEGGNDPCNGAVDDGVAAFSNYSDTAGETDDAEVIETLAVDFGCANLNIVIGAD